MTEAHHTMSQDVAHTGVAAGPGVLLWVLSKFHVALPDIAYIAAIAWVLLQAAYLIWRWRRDAKRR